MRVIGIDPGFDRCGVAIADGTKSKQELIASLCIETSRSDAFAGRLAEIGKKLEEVLAANRPEALAIETLFFSKNRTTALQVAEARGMILYIAARAGLPVYEYSPQAVKIAMTGSGASDKRAVTLMVERLYHPDHRVSRDDEYDAIAVAMTHLVSYTP